MIVVDIRQSYGHLLFIQISFYDRSFTDKPSFFISSIAISCSSAVSADIIFSIFFACSGNIEFIRSYPCLRNRHIRHTLILFTEDPLKKSTLFKLIDNISHRATSQQYFLSDFLNRLPSFMMKKFKDCKFCWI